MCGRPDIDDMQVTRSVAYAAKSYVDSTEMDSVVASYAANTNVRVLLLDPPLLWRCQPTHCKQHTTTAPAWLKPLADPVNLDPADFHTANSKKGFGGRRLSGEVARETVHFVSRFLDLADHYNIWLIIVDQRNTKYSEYVRNHPKIIFFPFRDTLRYPDADKMIRETVHGHGYSGEITYQWALMLSQIFSRIIAYDT